MQISQSTIWKFVQEKDVPTNINAVRRVLADKFFRTATKAVDSITDDKLEDANTVQSATVAGICAQRGRELVSGDEGINIAVLTLQKFGFLDDPNKKDETE